MSLAARRSIAAALAFAALAIAPASEAHPVGSTSVNRYLGASCSAAGRVRIAYLLDFAELPAYAEIEQLDSDHDGSVTPQEQRAYLERRLPPLVARWTLEVDGSKAAPRIVGSSLEVLPGEGGLSTLRIAADVDAEIEAKVAPPAGPASSGEIRVHVVDDVFADRSGWRQMAAEASPGVDVVSSTAGAAGDVLGYADAAGEAPPRVDDAVFTFRARSAGSGAREASSRPWLAAGALALASALGAAYALSRWRPRA